MPGLHCHTQIALLATVLLSYPTTSAAQTDAAPHSPPKVTYPARVGGILSTITEAGSFLMEDGTMIQPWGIRITNFEASKLFLLGRSIGCDFLFATRNTVFASCSAEERDPVNAAASLDLYTWLPELGWAERECNRIDQINHSANGDGAFYAGAFSYRCLDGNVPFRGEVIVDAINPQH